MTIGFRLGTTFGGLQYLETIGISTPNSAPPVDYAKYLNLASGADRGIGWLATTWRWGSLTMAEYALLAAYAGNCYLSTPNSAGAFDDYAGILVLKPSKRIKVATFSDVAAEFRALVEA